jgi:hypothetical protein
MTTHLAFRCKRHSALETEKYRSSISISSVPLLLLSQGNSTCKNDKKMIIRCVHIITTKGTIEEKDKCPS